VTFKSIYLNDFYIIIVLYLYLLNRYLVMYLLPPAHCVQVDVGILSRIFSLDLK